MERQFPCCYGNEPVVITPDPPVISLELREDGTVELSEDGTQELREESD